MCQFSHLALWVGMEHRACTEVGWTALSLAEEEVARSSGRQSEGATGSGHGCLTAGATDATMLSRADPSHMASISAQFCKCLPWLLFYCLGSVLGYKDTGLNEKMSMSLSS